MAGWVLQSQKLKACVRGMCAPQMEAGQDARQRMVNDKLAVSELATTALVALPPIVRLRELAEALRSTRHQAFPVTSDVKAALQSGARPHYLCYPAGSSKRIVIVLAALSGVAETGVNAALPSLNVQ